MPGQHLTAGAAVYDTAGEKVGTFQRYDPRGGFLAVRRGVLFPTDLFPHGSLRSPTRLPGNRRQRTRAPGRAHG
jgi:hypothetical protein